MSLLQNIINFYKSAKRTALLLQNNETKKWFHIYSVIELLPSDLTEYSIPTTEWFNNKAIRSTILSQSNEFSCYLVVQDLESTEFALEIFKTPLGKIIDGEENYFFNNSFIKEPESDMPLILSSNMHDKDGLGAVLPKHTSGLFVWAQIDFERITEKRFRKETSTDELKAMSELTTKWLGFDISAYSEHLGNLYLVAPNPYFRDFDMSLSTNPVGIFYQFKLRYNVSPEFKIRIIDHHGNYPAFDKIINVSNSIGLIELPHEPHLTDVKIYNTTDDLIYYHGPSAFIKSFNIGVSIKHADLNVKIAGKENSEFTVEKFSKETAFNSKVAADFQAHAYFKAAEDSRQYINLENSSEFIFFPGSKNEQEIKEQQVKAKETILEIINRASDTCFLVDPYFYVNDVIDYAFRIRSSGVNLRILNSKEQMNKAKAKELLAVINEYNSKPFQKIECRVLKGDSILHDRFVIIDTNVWFLGSSFNEFGKRASCIAKVPTSVDRKIIKEVEKWFYSEIYSQSIENYAAE